MVLGSAGGEGVHTSGSHEGPWALRKSLSPGALGGGNQGVCRAPGCVPAVEWKIAAGCRCIFNKAFLSSPAISPWPLRAQRSARRGHLKVAWLLF